MRVFKKSVQPGRSERPKIVLPRSLVYFILGMARMKSPIARVQQGLFVPLLHRHTFSPKGVAGLAFTARIERAPGHRARSASKKDGLAAPFRTF